MKSGVEHLAKHPGWKTKEVKPPMGLDDAQLAVLDLALTAAEEVLKTFKVGKSGLQAKSLTRFVATAFERHVTIHLATELANIAKHGHRNDDAEDKPKPFQQVTVFLEGGLVNGVIDLAKPKPEDGIEYEVLDYDVLEGSTPTEIKEYFDGRSAELRAYMQKALPDEYDKFMEAGR